MRHLRDGGSGAALSRRIGAVGHVRATRRALLLAAATWPALGWAGAVLAQSKQPILIGWLNGGSRESNAGLLAAFKEGLTALGWKEGSQLVIEERHADGRTDRLAVLAVELATKKPAVIVAVAAQATAAAAKAAPKTPIVQATGADPVVAGFATSLARPGGMITGLSNITADVTEKYLELLVAAAPKLKRIGFLTDSNNVTRTSLIEAARRSAAQYSIDPRIAEVGKPEEIEPAVTRLAKEGAQALVVLSSPLFTVERRRILKLASARGWPVVSSSRAWAEGGALLTYGVDVAANFRRAAYYVDRILKGTKPGELPIEQPTKIEMVVNFKTAKALGLTIPQTILVRADRMIE